MSALKMWKEPGLRCVRRAWAPARGAPAREARALFRRTAASSSAAPPVPQCAPEEVGLCPERLGRLDRYFHRYVDAGALPGCILAVARRGHRGEPLL